MLSDGEVELPSSRKTRGRKRTYLNSPDYLIGGGPQKHLHAVSRAAKNARSTGGRGTRPQEINSLRLFGGATREEEEDDQGRTASLSDSLL